MATSDATSRRRRAESPKLEVRVVEEVRTIGGWPTDTVTIDWVEAEPADADGGAAPCQRDGGHTNDERNSDTAPPTTATRTLLLFVPGNPGCVGWYVPMLAAVVARLGPGYSAAGTSYAGHGVGDATTVRPAAGDAVDAHTVDGQVDHKAEWVDGVLGSYDDRHRGVDNNKDGDEAPPPTRVVFVTHSIGAYLVQRLCVLRPDVLSRAALVVHLMPFVRFDPSLERHRLPLNLIAHGVPNLAVAFLESASRLASVVPVGWLDSALGNSVADERGRELAVGLVRQPAMARNFLRLGIDEIRSLPVARHDDSAMRIIGDVCPTAMLYCGGPDQWAPREHVDDLLELRRRGAIPSNVTVEYVDELLHDFVVRPGMVRPVIDFCVRTISGAAVAVAGDGDGGGGVGVDRGGVAGGRTRHSMSRL